MQTWIVAIAVAAVGCGGGAPAASSPQVAAAAPACPAAARVAVASWGTTGSYTGWELLMNVDGAGTASVPDGPAWLVTNGAAPCRATIGGSTWRGSGPPPRVVGRMIEGCAARQDPEAAAFVLFTDAAPTGCKIEVARPVACVPVAVEGGHPLMQVASLVDARGTAVVVAAGPGTYATFDATGGRLVRAREVVWMAVPEEAWSAGVGSGCAQSM